VKFNPMRKSDTLSPSKVNSNFSIEVVEMRSVVKFKVLTQLLNHIQLYDIRLYDKNFNVRLSRIEVQLTLRPIQLTCFLISTPSVYWRQH
jgi:hypothetical protein